MRGIDPCGSFSFSDSFPANTLSISLGKLSNSACAWFIGAYNSIAVLSKRSEASTAR